MTYELSVVIPTLGESPHLRGLLERLQRQQTSFPFEVLVVANVPRQSLRTLVNSMSVKGPAKFEYLETGRIGTNLARNKGLERASAPIVLFLDDDAILASDFFLTEYMERHRLRPDAVAIGGPYRLSGPASRWDKAYHSIAHDWLERALRRNGETGYLLGGNLSLKKNIVHQYRIKFDEEILFGGTETGLCERLALLNLKIVLFRDLEIGHSPRMGFLKFCRKAYLQGAGARWLRENSCATTRIYVNQLKPPACVSLPTWLYDSFYRFGWNRDSYSKSKSSQMPSVNWLRYLLFLVFDLKPVQRLRSFHRELYAALRTAR